MNQTLALKLGFKNTEKNSLEYSRIFESHNSLVKSASQYWYRKDTQQTLMEEIEAQTDENSKIAIIAAPTLYCHMREMNPNLAKRCVLFEFDMRFSVYGDQFAFYDINEPLGDQVLKVAQKSFDFIIADPPFWMEEYLEKLLMFRIAHI